MVSLGIASVFGFGCYAEGLGSHRTIGCLALEFHSRKMELLNISGMALQWALRAFVGSRHRLLQKVYCVVHKISPMPMLQE